MFENFEAYITSRTALTRDEIALMRALSTERRLRKRQFLLHEGEICRHKVFVVKGLLRTYRAKDDGAEYIMRFSPENCWSIDHESYNSQTPSRYNISALEDTDVILWTKEHFDELSTEIPALRSFSEEVKAHSMDESLNRILANISYTAEEKYEAFLASFPDVFRRVPLHMVASYLGLSRETLSRVRHAQRRRQQSGG